MATIKETQKHFAELCKLVWDEFSQMQLPTKEKQVAWLKFLVHITSTGWNIANTSTSLKIVLQRLIALASSIEGPAELVATLLYFVVDIKWNKYGDDTNYIESFKVSFRKEQPVITAKASREIDPDLADLIKG